MGTAAITFQPLERTDLPLIHEWLSRPHVAEWWGPPPQLDAMEAEFAELLDPTGSQRAYIAWLDDAPLGYCQRYSPVETHAEGWWLEELDPNVRGIDQFLANDDQLGRGLGTAMVRAFVALLFDDPSVWRVQTDPSPENARAIRCYEKAGFRVEGEVDTLDGRALLMYCDRPSHPAHSGEY